MTDRSGAATRPTRHRSCTPWHLIEQRSIREVIEDHLRLRLDGNLEADVERNSAADVVVVSLETVGRGAEASDAWPATWSARCGARFEIREVISSRAGRA